MAPEAMKTGTVSAIRSLVLSWIVPALIMSGPVKVSPAANLRMPGPVLVIPPGPEIAPLMVSVAAALVMSKLTLPPSSDSVL